MAKKDIDINDKNEERILKLICGIIMPISSQLGCSVEHWSDVREIIEESIAQIEEPEFEANLISDANDIGIIQKRIVSNLFSSEIVVCDVSCKNSNVMFELGMRLAFDKPTVLIKDDQTDFSFDIGVIEHLIYPRDLRFSKIISFKKQLADKIKATYEASKNPNHSTFLQSFGTFHVQSLTQVEASSDQLVLDFLQEMQAEMRTLRRELHEVSSPKPSAMTKEKIIALSNNARFELQARLYEFISDYLKKNNINDLSLLKQDPEFMNRARSKFFTSSLSRHDNEFDDALTVAFEMQKEKAKYV